MDELSRGEWKDELCRERIASASVKLGAWLSAALDDPHPCEEFKQDIRDWFEAMEQLPEYRAAFDFDNQENT